MKILWTERPVLLERELETHAWMIENRPWERFGLELVYDNAPGGWVRFSNVFADLWDRCRLEGDGFLNVESDVVPTWEAFESVLACPEDVCLVPYEHFPDPKLRDQPWGAVCIERVPGGYHSWFAQGTEKWAVEGDTGFLKLSARACRKAYPAAMRLTQANGLMYPHVYAPFSVVDARPGRLIAGVHLHWPGLRQNHRYWDRGDREHWPESMWDELDRNHVGELDPNGVRLPGRP